MKRTHLFYSLIAIAFLSTFSLKNEVLANELSSGQFSAKTKSNCRYGRYTLGRAKGKCRNFAGWCKLGRNKNKKACKRSKKRKVKRNTRVLDSTKRSCSKYGRYKSSGNCRTLAGWCKLSRNRSEAVCRGGAGSAPPPSGGKTIKTKGGVFPLKKCYGLKNDGGAGHFGASRRGGRSHTGVDWYAPKGSTVKAPWSGKIIASSYNSVTGNLVVIQHPNGQITRALHLNARNVKVGQSIKAGQKIGTVGKTGNARHQHPHLHFEVRTGPYRPCTKRQIRRRQCSLTRRYGRAKNPSRIFPGCQWDSKK